MVKVNLNIEVKGRAHIPCSGLEFVVIHTLQKQGTLCTSFHSSSRCVLPHTDHLQCLSVHISFSHRLVIKNTSVK